MRALLLVSAITIALSGAVLANEIYIDQVGDSLDLDITQDGQNNEFGDSTTDITLDGCLLYTSPSPRDGLLSRMPSSA